jgi:hypothetical protein
MHSEMPAEPTQAYVFAEKRKSLRYVGVFGCALEPPAIRHGHQAVREGNIAQTLDLAPFAASIVACPLRLFHFPSSRRSSMTDRTRFRVLSRSYLEESLEWKPRGLAFAVSHRNGSPPWTHIELFSSLQTPEFVRSLRSLEVFPLGVQDQKFRKMKNAGAERQSPRYTPFHPRRDRRLIQRR